MKINKVFIILFFLFIFAFLAFSSSIAGSPNLAAHFNSNGDLINRWYWLRDTSLQHYTQWIFERIPSGEYDLVLDINALATDRPNGRKNLPAEFYLIYETLGGEVLVRQKVNLPNISPPNDPVGYTCQGQVTIPRVIMQDSTVLLVRIERISPDDNHIAFHAESMAIMRAMDTETYLPDSHLGSQLPDTNSQSEAFLIQPGTYYGSLGEQKADGSLDREDWYGIELQAGQIINLQLIQPSGGSFALYLRKPDSSSSVGHTITQDNIRSLQYVVNVSGIWMIRIVHSSGEGDYRLFIEVSSYSPGQSEQSQTILSQGYRASKFYSNGHLIQGWYWLRDSTLNHYAEWTFEDIPAGNSDLVLDITALATDKTSGGRGFDGHFLLIYGFPGTARMGGVFQTKEIILPNVSPANDPVGYTCNGLISIPRDFVAGATTFFFRIERISPDDHHVAFNQDSILLFTDEQLPGYRR